MKILAIQHAVPAQKVTNADLLGTLRELSKDLVDTDHLDLLEKQIEDTLKTAGTQVRYKLGEDQKAIDLVLQASRSALENARVLPEEVDFLIYTGVGRGWLEPAMANVIQCEMKMPNATCFDLLDACASWLRGMQVAHSFLRNKTYRCGMIVNCECSLVRSFSSFGIRQVQDLQHQVAQFTI